MLFSLNAAVAHWLVSIHSKCIIFNWLFAPLHLKWTNKWISFFDTDDEHGWQSVNDKINIRISQVKIKRKWKLIVLQAPHNFKQRQTKC